MEQKIVMEGIYSMLEEIKEDVKKNSDLCEIKMKLETIENTCMVFKELATETQLIRACAYIVRQVKDIHTKEHEEVLKLKGLVMAHHKYIETQLFSKIENIGTFLEEERKTRQEKQVGIFKKFDRWLDKILNFWGLSKILCKQ